MEYIHYLVFWMQTGNRIMVEVDPDSIDLDNLPSVRDFDLMEWDEPDWWKTKMVTLNLDRVEAITYERQESWRSMPGRFVPIDDGRVVDLKAPEGSQWHINYRRGDDNIAPGPYAEPDE